MLKKIKRDNPLERSVFSEIIPMIDGPVRKPINPPVVTIAKPSTVLTPGIFAEAVNKTGTIQEHPNPIKTYPTIAIKTPGEITTIKNPRAANKLPTMTTFLLPIDGINWSPFSLPIVMAILKPA